MMNSKNKGLMFLGYGLFAIAIMALMAFVTMLLWNWLVPELFNGPVITFLQSLGLLALLKLLTGFSGMGGKKWSSSSHHAKKQMWKQKWDEKMAGMSEEEKASFKEMYYRRCGKPMPEKDTTANE